MNMEVNLLLERNFNTNTYLQVMDIYAKIYVNSIFFYTSYKSLFYTLLFHIIILVGM